MPFFKVTSHAILVEASDPSEAAMIVFRKFEDRTPVTFEVVGPDAEFAQVSLNTEQQVKALTKKSGRLTSL
jgi:hypothetical protein